MNMPNEWGRLPVTLPATVRVETAEEMRALGRWLASALEPGDLVILSGPLGAGKTTLTQGIADGLGVRGPVTSPTFVIARVHPPLRASGGLGGTRPPLVHADAYRLGSALELDDLDLDTDLDTSVAVVEWGEGRAEGLSEDRLEITITTADPEEAPEEDFEGDSPRSIRVAGVGSRWQDIQLPPATVANRL